MSEDHLDDIQTHVRNIERELMAGATMSFENATTIDYALDGIGEAVEGVREDTRREWKELIAVIEGLLANWPHSEVNEYYEPSAERSVLMKNEALLRAKQLIDARNAAGK